MFKAEILLQICVSSNILPITLRAQFLTLSHIMFIDLVFHFQSEQILTFETNMNFSVAKLKKLVTFETVLVAI